MSVRGLRLAAGLAPAMAFAMLLMFAGVPARAQAGEVSHPLLGSFGSVFTFPTGVAIDESPAGQGNVYVVNGGGPEAVEVFNREGVNLPTGGSPNQLTAVGAPPTEAFSFAKEPAGVAVDNSESVAKSDVYVTDVRHNVVDKFQLNGSNTYEYVSQLGGFVEPIGVTIDSQGNVYVADYGGRAVDEYTAEGVLIGQFSSLNIIHPQGVAVDSTGDIYIQGYSEGSLVEIARSSPVSTEIISEESLITHGVTGIAFDRTTGDLFVDLGVEVEEFNRGHRVVSTFGLGLIESSKGLAVAEKSGDLYVDSGITVLRFGTIIEPTPPSIEETSVTDVSGNSATLHAQINPEYLDTTYNFEYGTSESYGASTPVPAADIGAGTGGMPVFTSKHVVNLAPDTLYHYRVVATNQAGTTTGPDRTFTTQLPGAPLVLPDGRRYELVSPADKHGTEVRAISGYSGGGVPQASEDGQRFTFLTLQPPDLNAPGNGAGTQSLSTRDATGWSSQDIATPHEHVTGLPVGGGTEYKAFSSDLSLGVVAPLGNTPLTPDAPTEVGTIYLRDTLEGGYQALVTAAEFTPSGEKALAEARFAGASTDLKHVVIKSSAALTPGAVAGQSQGDENLYMYGNGQLQQVNVLPNGEPTAGGAIFGQAGSFTSRRAAISNDGSHIIWSYVGARPSTFYVRDMVTGKTVEADASQGGPDESGAGEFAIANDDSSKVFFLDTHRLTPESISPHADKETGDLYDFEPNIGKAGKLTDLTVDSSTESADVRSVIGVSEDGSYVYFVANGVLAPGAVPGHCEFGSGPLPECNLYVLHDDGSSWSTRFITRLSAADNPSFQQSAESMPEDLTARVSSDGRYLTFMSVRSLTGYDNLDAISGQPDAEVYIYHAELTGSGSLACVSCNPTGARPIGLKDIQTYEFGVSAQEMDITGAWAGKWVSGFIPGWTSFGNDGGAIYPSRILSDEGRLFFDSTDTLVPQDVNGQADVYEYEPDGVGSCQSARGCVSLISAGTGSQRSLFLDASASGNDVFLLTADQLVTQDFDHSFDVYDAHVCSTAVPCFVVPPVSSPSCTSSDACKPGPTPQPPLFGSPASATFSGPGNVVQATPPAAEKKARTKGKKQKHTKHHKQKSKHRRKSKTRTSLSHRTRR